MDVKIFSHVTNQGGGGELEDLCQNDIESCSKGKGEIFHHDLLTSEILEAEKIQCKNPHPELQNNPQKFQSIFLHKTQLLIMLLVSAKKNDNILAYVDKVR